MHDPLINRYHAVALGITTFDEIDTIIRLAFQVNGILQEYLLGHGIRLIDFKLEFGRLAGGAIVLADEISRTPAAFGTQRRTHIWIRTCSAAIWAAKRKPMPK